MRRFLFTAFILLIVCGVFFMVPERQAPSSENPYSALYRIMDLSGATVVQGELYFWASLGSCPQILTLKDLEEKADLLLEKVVSPGSEIGGGEPQDVHHGEKLAGQPPSAEKKVSHTLYEPQREGQIEAPLPDLPLYMTAERRAELSSGGELRLLLQRMEQEGESVVHLLLTVTQEGEALPLREYALRLPALLGGELKDANRSFCLTGHLEKKLTLEEMEELSNFITRKVGAEQIQSISDGKMISVTGYTPELGDYLRAQNLRINLNLAMRYDEYQGKTVIWAGTPLISRYY